MALTLHGFPFSTYTWAARMALHEKGVAYEFVRPDMRSEAYTALHPYRKMPVLEHDGFRVFEAAAIMRYVDEAFPGPALQPADVRARATMMQWVSAFNDYVAPTAVRGVLIPRFVLGPRGVAVDDNAVHAAAAAARKALAPFEAALATSPFLAGDELSLADLLLAPVFATGAPLAGRDRYIDGVPNLVNWFARIATRPSFRESMPS